ncbi:DUF2200 family protein [Collinsella tanakaei]|uniref:DUF2200 family protein n=1 Tax=Collinsella tanakaei TaxID=626935 RepID=A0A3E4QP09_9ACTN|nr:DUF2200 family protein [Collinsella tanakaei]RGL07523.1 DUF2200 family protein [Collinsella tanakaei]
MGSRATSRRTRRTASRAWARTPLSPIAFVASSPATSALFARDSLRQTAPNRALITGKVCGVAVESIEDPLMRELRYLDKLVDELAKGRPLEKICRA